MEAQQIPHFHDSSEQLLFLKILKK